ncbi:MAG: ATP-dependent sacrificial sulfur transferase LarE [Terrimicrobiaceae bacterium]
MTLLQQLQAQGLDELANKVAKLAVSLNTRKPLLVAYSGGVDSSCLLSLAHQILGNEVLGIIADSPSLPRRSLAAAIEQAKKINVLLEILNTGEFEDSNYVANPPNRCYFCKAELFDQMNHIAAQRGYAAIAYGENADDPPHLRPGSAAAQAFSVVAPLREAGLGKNEVRTLAKLLGLSSAELPAQPCLSSRISHGIPVTREAIAMVERAEEALHDLGFQIVRVRLMSPSPAKALIQVAPAELPKLQGLKTLAFSALKTAGFEDIAIDPEGYRGAGLL